MCIKRVSGILSLVLILLVVMGQFWEDLEDMNFVEIMAFCYGCILQIATFLKSPNELRISYTKKTLEKELPLRELQYLHKKGGKLAKFLQ